MGMCPPNHRQNEKISKKTTVQLLKDTRRVVSDNYSMTSNKYRINKRTQLRAGAKIPILMFNMEINNVGKIDIDLSVDDLLKGVKNSHFIYSLSNAEDKFKYLVLLVKMWSKNCGINDAPLQRLSSYTFTLLLIFYLQSGCNP